MEVKLIYFSNYLKFSLKLDGVVEKVSAASDLSGVLETGWWHTKCVICCLQINHKVDE